MKKLWPILLCFCLLQCETDHRNSCSVPTQAHGFGFSPRGFPNTYNRTVEFFEDMENLQDAAVMWNGSWRDDAINGEDAGTVPAGAELIQSSSFQYCYVPVPVFGWRNGETNLIQIPSSMINDWTNIAAREKFINMLVTFVNEYRPPYIFLGNENDFYFESNPSDYTNWIIAYNLMYNAIKQVSQETLVGPVFNFEHISGNGQLNAWTQTFWQALDAHDMNKVDVVGVSVYPFFNFEDPADIPNNYLQPLLSRVGSRPVVITETGWPAWNLGNLNPQWSTTEENQVTYVSRLQAFTSGENIPVMNWLYYNGLNDDGSSSEAWKIFGSVSIRNRQGINYQVYPFWVDL